MKAVVIHAAGDVRIDEVTEQPMGPHEVRVRIAAGGICGSDLHYVRHGGFGQVRLRGPMILGHEIAGVVEACGEAVTTVAAGVKVAVNPALPCGVCRYCREGLHNHCEDMRFYGSAMRTPHVDGGFRERIVCHESQAVPVPDDVPVERAAFAEPLAVALHAVERAGPLLGRRILVTGAGPIGVLLVAAARRAGAGTIVATDIVPAALGFARAAGADEIVDVAAEADRMARFEAGKGFFDVVFEASGNASAVLAGLRAIRPRGVFVCVGQGAEVTLQMSLLVAKEVDLRGAFRFDREFATAVAFIAKGLVEVDPLLTAAVGFAEAKRGFELAADKSRSMKVQLRFS